MTMRFGLALLIFVHAVPSFSAWIGTCPGIGTGTVLERYLRIDGAAEALVIANEPVAGCDGTTIHTSADHVLWARLIARPQAETFTRGITLKGPVHDGRLEVSEISPADEPAPREHRIPAGTQLLPLARLSVFGIEERAEARTASGAIVLECRAGASPAGIVMTVPEPEPPGMSLALKVEYRAQGTFTWGASDAARAARGDPLMLGSTHGDTDAAYVIPAAVAHFTGSYSITVACPPETARIEMTSLKLEPAPSNVPRRALWAWQPAAWMDAAGELLDRAARLGAGTIYVTVPVAPDAAAVTDPGTLVEFVAKASARGMAVWAVAGDPRAVLPSGRATHLRLARAYAAYNSQAPATSRLAGIQFDIEPYLNPGYHLDVDGWLSAYLDTIAELRRETRLPLEVAIPFWWSGQILRGSPLLDRLAPLVDGIAVMNYRTDPALIKRFAEPLLAWGTRYRRHVRIALESGPIPDEVSRHYRPAAKGPLWLLTFGGQSFLVLMDGPAANPTGAAFAFSHQTPAAGSAVTFRGRARALKEILPALESAWSAWPAFAGVALHEPEED